MRASEVIRIIVFSLIGGFAMFLGQPWIYRSRFPFVRMQVPIENWLSQYYMTGASIVFVVSVLATVTWYWMAAKAPARGGRDVENWSLIWWLIFLLPVISVCIAIAFFKGTDQALLSLTTFFVIDVLFLYWFTTASSSPGSLQFVPPGAFLIRRLFRK
jgi:sterol desaturase/sphingolipid hydroxylase (fatty acid hydroxylase superfamily)